MADEREPTAGDVVDVVQRHGVIRAFGYRWTFVGEFRSAPDDPTWEPVQADTTEGVGNDQ